MPTGMASTAIWKSRVGSTAAKPTEPTTATWGTVPTTPAIVTHAAMPALMKAEVSIADAKAHAVDKFRTPRKRLRLARPVTIAPIPRGRVDAQ